MAQYRRVLYATLGKGFLYPEEDRAVRLTIAGDWLLTHPAATDDPAGYGVLGRELGSLVPRLTGNLRSAQTAWVAMFHASRSENCLPYEGAFVGRQFPGVVQGRLLREYGEAGLVTGTHQEPDHCAVELEFMSYLCNQESCAGDPAEREMAINRQRDFLQNHLLVWFPLFAKRSQGVGRDDRYLLLIDLANRVLDLERQEVVNAA